MRLNIISNNRNQTGLSQDADLIHGLFAHAFGDALKVARTPHFHPIAPECDVNIFLEVINPILFNYAGYNIWIPNPEWTYKTWVPYMEMVDEIWVKTKEAEETFKGLTTKPVKFIGWTSIAKEISEKKNYHKAFVAVGKNIFRHPQLLIDAYASDPNNAVFPDLYIPYDPKVFVVTIPESIAHRVHTYGVLKQKEYDELLDECGLLICLSGAEGFGHAVNEAMSTGCNLLLSNIAPFHALTENAIWVADEKVVPHPECFADIHVCSEKGIQDALHAYAERTFQERKILSTKVVTEFTVRHQEWIARMTEVLDPLRDRPANFSIKDRLPKEEDLPGVSIVTPTRDRLQFMELSKVCFESLAYPRDKLEWIVIDDGEISCKHILKDMENVKYVWEETGKTIAWKRNLGVRMAKYDIICHMDDDDVYPHNSIIERVSNLLRAPAVGCVLCTTIPCYDIKNYISFVNVPPTKLEMSARVSEATMCFTRAFWEEHPFDDTVKIAEGHTFIRGREQRCREICPEQVIVSLVHPKTTSSRKAPAGMEPNGCHYGFSEDLFKAVSEIGQAL